jgi:hypothetical protein
MMQINLAPSAEFSPFSVIGIGIVNMIFLIFGLKSLATRPATNKTRSGPFMENKWEEQKWWHKLDKERLSSRDNKRL